MTKPCRLAAMALGWVWISLVKGGSPYDISPYNADFMLHNHADCEITAQLFSINDGQHVAVTEAIVITSHEAEEMAFDLCGTAIQLLIQIIARGSITQRAYCIDGRYFLVGDDRGQRKIFFQSDGKIMISVSG